MEKICESCKKPIKTNQFQKRKRLCTECAYELKKVSVKEKYWKTKDKNRHKYWKDKLSILKNNK